MDSFKPAEISRMELGGNNSWKEFWEGKSGGQKWGKPGQGGDGNAMTLVGERYGGDEGEEYKERLGCKVDGREFSGMPVKERRRMESRGVDASTARTSSPLAAGGRAAAEQPRSQKAQNEDFFARKGNENAARPEGLAPSQGGKYGGFGSEPVASTSRDGGGRDGAGGALPGVDDFQKDPVAALSKGFGWFTSTVGKGAKTVNDGWIQPTAQKVRGASSLSPPPSNPSSRTGSYLRRETCLILTEVICTHADSRSRPRHHGPPHRRPGRKDHPNRHQGRRGPLQQLRRGYGHRWHRWDREGERDDGGAGTEGLLGFVWRCGGGDGEEEAGGHWDGGDEERWCCWWEWGGRREG